MTTVSELTTAASNPTVCRMVKSLVLSVGITQPKNPDVGEAGEGPVCAGGGEKSVVS